MNFEVLLVPILMALHMTRMSPRTHFHSSKLIRCLADLTVIDTADFGNAFAEKLGSWVHFADAIALSAVHNDSAAITSKLRTNAQAGANADIAIEFDRVQSVMKNSIMKSFSRNSGSSHMALPSPTVEQMTDLGVAYVPYRRFYETHQRDMELMTQSLRSNVRSTIAKISPRLKKLAELDALFEKILRDRENKLLSRVPALLIKRFEHLFKQHQQQLATTQQADNSSRRTQDEDWLMCFCNDMQMLLLAEMEFRLQPTMGLIEAFKQETQ